MGFFAGLLDCYENIPKSFFAESFTFDFGKVLSRETKKLSEFQDEVEKNREISLNFKEIASCTTIWTTWS